MSLSGERVSGGPDDNDVDEVVLNTVDVHIERMSDGAVWMAFYRKGVESRLVFWMTAERKGELHTAAYWEGKAWKDVKNQVQAGWWNEASDG